MEPVLSLGNLSMFFHANFKVVNSLNFAFTGLGLTPASLQNQAMPLFHEVRSDLRMAILFAFHDVSFSRFN